MPEIGEVKVQAWSQIGTFVSISGSWNGFTGSNEDLHMKKMFKNSFISMICQRSKIKSLNNFIIKNFKK